MKQEEFPFDLKTVIARAESWAREAGTRALEMQGHLNGVKYKTPKDVVTAADLESEKIIVSHIKEEFPEFSIRTEEAGMVKSGSPYEWIIDPVDGTVNFSRGIPLWGVSIALVKNATPLLSAIFLPGLGNMYTAYKGGGTFCNKKPVRVSTTDSLSKAVVSNGDFNVGDWAKINAQNLYNFEKEALNCTRVKCYGSAVIEGTFTASGSLDVFVMTMSYPWDIAGIALMVTEAGGKVTKLDGRPICFVDGEQVLFSNGILHDEVVKMLAE
ncbi:MAG: inositol monophosphatase [Fibrobacteraceae bacterium]